MIVDTNWIGIDSDTDGMKLFLKKIIVRIFMALYFMLILTLAMMLVSHAEAKIVSYGSGVEQIRLEYGSPKIFRFTKPVQTITGASRFEINPANDKDATYTDLSIKPRFTNGVTEVNFFLSDKSIVRTKIIVSPKDPAADGFYDFRPRDALNADEQSAASNMTEVELLKAMVRDDDVISGYKISKTSQAFPSKTNNARVELIRIYKGSPFNGYVFRVTNTSWRKLVEVDVRHITVGDPNLAILSQSDETELTPKGKGTSETLVRVVAKNTASSGDVILAMESDDTAKKGE